jgi:hypothetical protein
MNESTITEKISRVLTSGLLSSKKEVEVGYDEDLRDDSNGTQDTSPHPLISVSLIRFKKESFG